MDMERDADSRDNLAGLAAARASATTPSALQVFATSSDTARSGSPWWSPWFVLDYVTVLVLGALWLVWQRVPEFERSVRPADLANPDLSYEMKPDIVSTPLLVFIAVGIPIIVGAIVYGAILALTGRKTFGSAAGVGVSPAVVRSFVLLDAHSFLVGLLLATLATAFVTDVIKGFAGRFRPDFLARCKWSAELNACTGNKKDISDGRRSFPSGHSSESFAGMTFLALFLGTVWSRIFDVEGSVWGRRTRAWRIILPFAPLLISTYCAISRIQQDVHHPTDVAAGAALGAAIAAIVYFFYYRV